MNGIPLRILNRNYVLCFTRPEGWGTDDIRGWCDPVRALIFISTELPEGERREVILHEVLHALWFEYAWPGVEDEEKNVTWVARAVTEFIAGNKEFAREQLL